MTLDNSEAAMSFFHSETFTFILLPVLIFLARVFDVSFGTIRIIFISRGRKFLAPAIGFFEILIWLVAIGKVMQNLDNVFCYIAYAGGFAAGNFMGICIEEKLAMGTLMVQIVTKQDASALIDSLKSSGYGVTAVPAHGTTGQVHIVYSIIKRSALKDVVAIVKRFNPMAFYSIEDVKFASQAIFPLGKSWRDIRLLGLLRLFRKGK
jgi:uncharacterized protein YebE (UPF0316 family)